MTYLIIVTGVSLSVVFTIAVLLIHAQPYDDPELRALIMQSDDCDAPCFMGIHPGITTVGDAMAILKSNQWVESVLAAAPDPSATQSITWQWREDAPSFVQSGKSRNGGSLYVHEGIVQNINVMTGIPFGTAWLHWGAPEQYTILAQTGGPIGGPMPPRPLTYVYQDIILIGWTECADFNRFWQAKIAMIFGDPKTWLKTVIPLPALPGTTPVTHFVRDVKTNSCP